MRLRQHLGGVQMNMMHQRYLSVVVLRALLLGGSADRSRGAETNADLGPTTQIARRAEDVPFINGGLTIP